MNTFKQLLASIIFISSSSFITASVPTKFASLLALRTLNTESNRAQLPNIEAAVTKKFQFILHDQTFFNFGNHKPIISSDHQYQHSMTRDQANQAIENEMVAIFDGKDTTSPLTHLEHIKNLTQYLDPETDKAAIKAIKLVSENKNRTSFLFDSYFWMNAWYGTGELRGLPVPQKIRDIPLEEMRTKISQISKKL